MMSEQNSLLERMIILLSIGVLLLSSVQISLQSPLPTTSDARALMTTAGNAESMPGLFHGSSNIDGSLNVVRAAVAFFCGTAGVLYDAPTIFIAVGLVFLLIPFACIVNWRFPFLGTPGRRIGFSGVLLFTLMRSIHPSEGLNTTPALAAIICILIALLDFDFEAKQTRYIARGLTLLSGLTGILASCTFPAFAVRYYRTRQRDLGILTGLTFLTFLIQLMFMLNSEHARFIWLHIPFELSSTVLISMELLFGGTIVAGAHPHIPYILQLVLTGAVLFTLIIAGFAYAFENQQWPIPGAFCALLALMFFVAMQLSSVSGGATACSIAFSVFLFICAIDKRVPTFYKSVCSTVLGISVFLGANAYIVHIADPPCSSYPANRWGQQVTAYEHGNVDRLPTCPPGTSIALP